MIRILLVDDHPVVRKGLRTLIAEFGDMAVEGEVGTGAEAVFVSRGEPWDLIILDMLLPDTDGLEVLKQLRLDAPQRPVLVLTVSTDTERALRAIRAGAAGYLLKNCDADELHRAIRRVVEGQHYIPSWLGEHLAANVDRDADQPQHAQLSDREFEVLVSLAAGRSVQTVASELKLSPKTVSTYRARVLQKLGLHNNAELAAYAIRHGLL
jgi:DNA-binding NarL/FixJ family response regulator